MNTLRLNIPLKSVHDRMEAYCSNCLAIRVFAPGEHAVGNKFFWSCGTCGESVALSDWQVNRYSDSDCQPQQLTLGLENLSPLQKCQEVDGWMEVILAEYRSACGLFGPFHSAHEGLGILLEEFEELKTEIFKSKFKDGQHSNLFYMQEEAVQVAAMALRFLVDIK